MKLLTIAFCRCVNALFSLRVASLFVFCLLRQLFVYSDAIRISKIHRHSLVVDRIVLGDADNSLYIQGGPKCDTPLVFGFLLRCITFAILVYSRIIFIE